MKNKFIVLFCLLILPFLAFAEEENDVSLSDNIENSENVLQEQQKELPKETSEVSKDEVALNLPSQDLINNDLNLSQTPSSIAPEAMPKNTFPVETALGYNFENTNSSYFLQTKGTDILNKSKTRKVDFLIKVPYFQTTDSINKFGITPERFYVNFIDPFLRINLGDNKYHISTLTVKDLEKRGGSLSINYNDKVGLNTLYLFPRPTRNKNPSENIGASFFIEPSSFLKFSSNFLFTKFEKAQFSIPIKNYTYSLRSTISFDEKSKLDLEAATTNKIDQRNTAFFANLDGKNNNFKYLISGLYANPHFVGTQTDRIETTYSDKAKLDSLVRYDVNKFTAKLSHAYETNNLDKIKTKANAKRSSISELTVSYPFINVVKASFGLKTKESKNLLRKDGHKLNAINFNVQIPLNKYSADHQFELGRYKSRIENYYPRNWYAYKLFLKYDVAKTSKISVYTKLGNLIYDDIFTTSYAAGTDLIIKNIKNLDLLFAYEYSTNTRKSLVVLKNKSPKWKGHYFKQNLVYTFPNQHKLTVTSHLNKPLDEKKEKAFLLTYTIPLEVPKIDSAYNYVKNSLF